VIGDYFLVLLFSVAGIPTLSDMESNEIGSAERVCYEILPLAMIPPSGEAIPAFERALGR